MLVVQGKDEQVATLQVGQHSITIGLTDERVTQQPAQPVPGRSLHQETLRRFGLAVHYLFAQIFQHQVVPPR